MKKLYLDLETYSPIPISYGAYKYAEKAEILLWSYALDNSTVKVWDKTSEKMPRDLYYYLQMEDIIYCAHGSFDRIILEEIMGITHPYWYDTMITAYQHSLPGSLAELCKFFGLPEEKAKIKRGEQLIDLFCKPLGKNRKLDRATKETHPTEWQEFVEYAKRDVIAMREIDKLMPHWNCTKQEYNLWQIDQKINQRGFLVDIDLASKMVKAIENEKEKNKKIIYKLTNGKIKSATQRDALLTYVNNLLPKEKQLPNLQAPTVTYFLQEEKLPNVIKKLLILRQKASKISAKKYEIAISAHNKDGRMRGTLQFRGADKTGRWSGKGIQPHNFPRPKLEEGEINDIIHSLKNNKTVENISSKSTSVLRGLIISDKGKKLLVSDLSGIESRVVAWIADEYKVLDAYREVDKGIGYDMYIRTYASTFSINESKVTDEQRQIGKLLVLAFGYGGGFGAFCKIAKNNNINLQKIVDKITLPDNVYNEAKKFYDYLVDTNPPSENEHTFITIDGVKRLWRNSNAKIAAVWKSIENAAKLAILNGLVSTAGKCVFSYVDNYLRIRLPSGRYLCYPSALYIDKKLSYIGKYEQSKRKAGNVWGRIETYGGSIVENICQAIAGDILASGILNAEKYGYNVILTVHDEIVAEVPDNEKFTHEKLSALMTTNPLWAVDLPLQAKGFETYRYKKE